METSFTSKGMMAAAGHKVRKRVEKDGGVYYLKDFFPVAYREQMYRAYNKLYSLGVGIPYTPTAEGVRMVGGLVLPRAIQRGVITKGMKRAVLAKIDGIQRALRAARWAHTDVKPENVVIIKRSDADSVDVYLIDNDFALPFGQERMVSTRGVNASFYAAASEIVDMNTDVMGFQAVVDAINANV